MDRGRGISLPVIRNGLLFVIVLGLLSGIVWGLLSVIVLGCHSLSDWGAGRYPVGTLAVIRLGCWPLSRCAAVSGAPTPDYERAARLRGRTGLRLLENTIDKRLVINTSALADRRFLGEGGSPRRQSGKACHEHRVQDFKADLRLSVVNLRRYTVTLRCLGLPPQTMNGRPAGAGAQACACLKIRLING